MDSQKSWKARLGDESFWLRLPFMLLFFLAWKLAELVLIGVILVQVLMRLFLGQPQSALQALGAQLSRYAHQIFRYLTFNSEQKPFPFSDWPGDETADPDPYQDETSQGEMSQGETSAPQEQASTNRPGTHVE